MEKSCVICGELFESNYQRKKYCSNDCRREADRRRLRIKWAEDPNCKREKICQLCGKELPKNKTRFCSAECRNRFNHIKTGRISHNTELIKTCVVCGKQFTTWHSAFVACSDECRERYKRPYDPERERARYLFLSWRNVIRIDVRFAGNLLIGMILSKQIKLSCVATCIQALTTLFQYR